METAVDSMSARRPLHGYEHDDAAVMSAPATTATPVQVIHSFDNDYDDSRSSSIFQTWLLESAWPGLGLFGESYMLFSLGTLQPLWQILMPDCWLGNENNDDNMKDDQVCPRALLDSLTYSVVLGVMLGMVAFGLVANRIGRRVGSILTATFMALGASGLTLTSMLLVNRPRRLLQCMSTLLFVFGIGVGGEYPLSAASSSERTMEHEKTTSPICTTKQQVNLHRNSADPNYSCTTSTAPPQKRGRAVQFVFMMQGMGIFFNSFLMMVLLVITGQTGRDGNYNHAALQAIWNITYALGAAILLYVLVSRWQHLRESEAWQRDKLHREQLAASNGQLVEATSHKANEDMIASHRNDIDHRYYELSDGDHACSIRVAGAPASAQPYPTRQQEPFNCITSPSSSSVSSLSAPSVTIRQHDPYTSIRDVASAEDVEDAEDIKDHYASNTKLLLRHFGIRLVGVSLCWLLWDVAFYGNKLFQSTFLLALTGQETTTLLQFAMAATLNSFVALCGYFGAAMLLDHPYIGRFRLQLFGFLLTGVLFVSVGFSYESLSPTILVIMYLGSSFFGQLGPNATTFIIPAEIFPTEMRTLSHGMAAASGKLGALLASILFNRVTVLDMFLFSGYASFAACLLTYWTIPESNGLVLAELDRKWRLIVAGRKTYYDGPANAPQFLSNHECHTLLQAPQRREHTASHGVESPLEGIYE